MIHRFKRHACGNRTIADYTDGAAIFAFFLGSNPQSGVRACAQLVKPGGDVFFSTLNRNGKSWLMAVVGAEYILRMVPKGTHDVKKFIKPAELLGWVDQTSLKERHITGLHYNPITNTFKLGPGVDVNYMLHTQNK